MIANLDPANHHNSILTWTEKKQRQASASDNLFFSSGLVHTFSSKRPKIKQDPWRSVGPDSIKRRPVVGAVVSAAGMVA